MAVLVCCTQNALRKAAKWMLNPIAESRCGYLPYLLFSCKAIFNLGKETETLNKYFNTEFIKENMMGPNAVKLLKELTHSLKLNSAMRILDLGCGKGLTSIYLADKFHVNVFAMDLWIIRNRKLRQISKDRYGTKNRSDPCGCTLSSVRG